MRIKLFFLCVFGVIAVPASAQDKIYKKDGSMIEAKVEEIGRSNITYKRFDNPVGPDYVLNKNEVERILYQNGTEDYISGTKVSDKPLAKPGKKMTYGSNVISAAVINLNDEGFGVGLAYERALDKRGFVSFYLPVNVTFGDVPDFVHSETLVLNSSVGTIWQIMPGIKFYPTGSKGKVRYAIGAQMSYEQGHISRYQGSYNAQTGTFFPQGYKSDIQKFGVLVNNSLNLNPTEHFYMGVDLGLGLTYVNKGNVFNGAMMELGTEQLAQFNFRIGYRF